LLIKYHCIPVRKYGITMVV